MIQNKQVSIKTNKYLTINKFKKHTANKSRYKT